MKPKLFLIPTILFILAATAFSGSSGKAAPFQIVALPNTSARLIQVAGCEQEDVQAAINLSKGGDIVQLQAGTCTWSTQTAQTPSVVIDNKDITLQGAGMGQTIILDATTLGWNEIPLRVDSAMGKGFRVTGLSIVGQGQGYDSNAMISIYGDSKAFRVDHIRFENITGRSVSVSGYAYGVIDHCEFRHVSGQAIIVMDNRGTPEGSTAWSEPMSFGTASAVYIEDSLFRWDTTTDMAIDCKNGGRYTFRHNTVEGIAVGNHGMDSVPRSCMQMEIYANHFQSATDYWLAVRSRGGTAVIFNNTFEGYQMGIGVTNYRSCCYAGAICTPSPDPAYPTCDGTSPLDGNTLPQASYKGWPCKDQIGRGSNQSSEPLYAWGNTLDGAATKVNVTNTWDGCTDPQPSDHIQENRDYYNAPRPGYTPYPYPHPLTKELVLHGAPADQAIFLNWEVKASLPVTATWTINYTGLAGSEASPIEGVPAETRAYTLNGLTNYTIYSITLSTNPSLFSDSIQLMPTGRLVYLPAVVR